MEKKSVLILAAGLGKRMCSSHPKVLHLIFGKPMIFHQLSRIQEAFSQVSVGIVVGYGKQEIQDAIEKEKKFFNLNLSFIFQEKQQGTGDAVKCALASSWGQEQIKLGRDLIVLPGDVPFISSALLLRLAIPLNKKTQMRLLVCERADPKGYGRILRDPKNQKVQAIVEEKDADAWQKKIQEVATSVYVFKPHFLQETLRCLSNKNAQGEFYLTDVVALGSSKKAPIEILKWENTEELQGINDLWELSQLEKQMVQKKIAFFARKGVRFYNPESIHLEDSVELAEGVIIYPNVVLQGKTCIEKEAIVGPNVVLKDVYVGSLSVIRVGTVAEKVVIGTNTHIGPYAHLRPETAIGSHVKIGNFVELKKTKILEGTQIAHLSYLGDAEVGKKVNIGCGFVTCNFDGRIINGERKHKTFIEDGVFIGSDCQVIAPIKIKKGAYIASGSTITQDVDANALAIARSRQVNKPHYAKKLKKTKKD